MICLYLKLQERFVSFILQNAFLVVHTPLIQMVKFEFLAQSPAHRLSQPVVSSLKLFFVD